MAGILTSSRAAVAAVALLTALPALLSGCAHKHEEQQPSSAAPAPTAAPSTPAAAPAPPGCGDPVTLPTRDKLAQLLMVGVKDAADARAVVNEHHVGGIFIGSWTDLSMLKDGSLKQIAQISEEAGPLPLAVSVDEEGGRVQRLSSIIGKSPSAKALAQNNTPQQVHDEALERGRKMHELGITIDFAPVVDVVESSTDDDTVIGDRSFGSDPAKVVEYAGAYAQGLRDAGLLPVLKHFPGHGHGSGDSHTGAVTTPPLQQLINEDLVPYRTLATQAPVAVMIGHMQVPGLTGDLPASVSSAAVTLLREGTGYGGAPFDGPVFSDDLSSMVAITARMGVSEAVLSTLRAGIDVALWVTTTEVPAVLDHLEKALAAGDLTMDRVDASVRRVAAAKGPNPHCGG